MENDYNCCEFCTHDILVVEDDDYQKWAKGELFYVEDSFIVNEFEWNTKFIDKQKLISRIKEVIDDPEHEFYQIFKDFKFKFDEEDITILRDDFILTLDTFRKDAYEEFYVDENEYTTKGGELIHIICKYY